MRAVFAAVLAASLAISPASAEWPLADMNRTIEQTNFIVNNNCSGTLISLKEKLLLTNYHCVDNLISTVERDVTNAESVVVKRKFRKYDDVPVQQNQYDGFVRTGSANFVGDIVAESKTRDLAVVKLKGKIPHTYATPILPEGKTVTRGEVVYIVGNPLGEDATVVQGIVSNVNRAFDFPWTDGARLPMIQVSGGIAGGNSGGALYNRSGELIGVPAAGYRQATHIGFAIPMDVVKPFLKENCLAIAFDAQADDAACREAKAKKSVKDNKGSAE